VGPEYQHIGPVEQESVDRGFNASQLPAASAMPGIGKQIPTVMAPESQAPERGRVPRGTIAVPRGQVLNA
jgi:hypothetical protein